VINRIKQFAYGVSVVVVGNVVYDKVMRFYIDHTEDVEMLKEKTERAAEAVRREFDDTEGEV
jgi:hypothetical protein